MLLTKEEIELNWKILMPVVTKIRNSYDNAPSDVKKRYTAHGNSSLLFSYAYYVGIVKKYAKSDSIILDWGGFYGQVSCMLDRYFPGNTICYLPEIDDTIRFWHENFSVNKVVISKEGESVAKINEGDGKIDVVVSSGVLEHTYEYGVQDIDALKEIYRILSPDGLLVIWHLPAQYAASDLISKVFGRYYHIKRYTKDEISHLLMLTGFEVIEIESHDIFLPRIRSFLGKIFGEITAFYIENTISRLPLVSIFSQQITIVARKKDGFIFQINYDGKFCI